MAKRYELSNEAWGVISGLFTEAHGRGKPRLSDRLMLDGMLWALCSGAAWHDIAVRVFAAYTYSMSASGRMLPVTMGRSRPIADAQSLAASDVSQPS